MTLAEKMILYRAKHDLSQAELAERCKLTVQTINSIENETQTPSKITEVKIRLVVEEDD